MIAFAVNITFVPEQMVLAFELMLILGAEFGFTLMLTPLEIADVGFAQPIEELKVTVTTSELLNVEVLKLGELLPTLLPLTFH